MKDYSPRDQLFDDAIDRGDLARLEELVAREGGAERIDDALLVHMAVNRKQPELLEWILSQGFDPNQNDPGESYFESTPLFWATFSRDRRMMEALVRYGASVGAEVGGDETSLHLVASDGDIEGIMLLLEHAGGRDALEMEDYIRRTPLQCAMESQNMTAVRILLEAGADGSNLEEPIDGPALLAALQQDALERQVPPTQVRWRFSSGSSSEGGERKNGTS